MARRSQPHVLNCEDIEGSVSGYLLPVVTEENTERYVNVRSAAGMPEYD
jgi:hypothetical protein